MTDKEVIDYWIDSSLIDFKAMESLFYNGHYVWTLFTGHLVIEKLLKAFFVKTVDRNVPQIHHLLRIAELAKLEMAETQKDLLLELTAFNIRARYPDYKRRFYLKATKDFTEAYLNKINELREWLLKELNK
jgi:HEPN domain-containing protein